VIIPGKESDVLPLSTPLEHGDKVLKELSVQHIKMIHFPAWEKSMLSLVSEACRLPEKVAGELSEPEGPVLLRHVHVQSYYFSAIRNQNLTFIEQNGDQVTKHNYLDLSRIEEGPKSDTICLNNPLSDPDSTDKVKINRPRLRHFQMYIKDGLPAVVEDLTLIPLAFIHQMSPEDGALVYSQAFKRLKPFLAIA